MALCCWLFLTSTVQKTRSAQDGQAVAALAWRIDINAAPAHELTLLPRIGPTLADRIVADRAENGRFDSLEDLSRVRGIGPRTVLGVERDAIVRFLPDALSE
jgi:competence protein ComEA